ncbi:MAG: TlpA family protein disulfide reductase [Treponema sp.]|nr:TlpA family protein disulfide reductase [Treponema sp.]
MTKKLKLGLLILVYASVIVIAITVFAVLSVSSDSEEDYERIAVKGTDSEYENTQEQKDYSNGKKAADFSMTDINGNTVSLHDFIALGKPIVLNFWASWCPPCRDEMPEFDTVYRELGSSVQFMMVDLTDNVSETLKTGLSFIKTNGFSFPVFFDVNQEGAYVYNIRSIPTTLFIDTRGYIINVRIGSINERTLRNEINKIR